LLKFELDGFDKGAVPLEGRVAGFRRTAAFHAVMVSGSG
jgi:hypothetical protein